MKDSLGGTAKTIMIACINPSDESYDETMATLRYATRAKNVWNQPIQNINPTNS